MAVLNKHLHGIPAGSVYCGRGSDWGNRFRIGSGGDRDAVCDKHEADLADRPDLLKRLADGELRGRDLVCFCAQPGRHIRCHCDLLDHLSSAGRYGMERWWKALKAGAKPGSWRGHGAPAEAKQAGSGNARPAGRLAQAGRVPLGRAR